MAGGFFRGGKMEQRHEKSDIPKGVICWCGDPNCPGGLRGNAETSADDLSAAFRNAREIVMNNDFGIFVSRLDPQSRLGTTKPSGPPPSYLAARDRVKDWLLSAGRDSDWGDVVGQEDATAALREAIEEPVLNAELYRHYGMKAPRGVLLSGPPGCGKTLLARSAASAMARVHGKDAEFAAISGPSIQSPYVGQTEKHIRDLFAFAREYAKYWGHPLIIFFDEAEAILPDRTGRVRAVAPWEESQVATFLAEMDGIQECGAFVILATNRPEALDEALLRDGRCDRKIVVRRPSRQAAEVMIRRSMATVPRLDPEEDLVVAAVESFYSPHRVLMEGSLVRGHTEERGPKIDSVTAINFCLEHIVSGAMLMGLAARAKARAFRRDRDAGTVTGVTVRDVIDAVTEVYEENQGLSHSFALREFVEEQRTLARATIDTGGRRPKRTH